MAEFAQIGHIGSPIESGASDGTVPPSDPIELAEHDSTEPFEISPPDSEFLERIIASNSPAPLSISYTRDGRVSLRTGSHVGVLTLPSGTQIEISPKESVTRLLWTLQYAFDTPVDSMSFETDFATASSFFDAIGILFWNELRAVLNKGLHRGYVRTQAVEEHVRGRIDVQRQLQRSGPQPTDFTVEYDKFTPDTVLNQAVLAAARVLVPLVRDPELAGRLRHQEQRLRQFTTVTSVSVEAVNRIELSRLNEHYEMLLDLTKTVLSREFFEDIKSGENRALALFVNMNDIFERIVERSFRAAAKKLSGLKVEGQASIQDIVEGPHAVSMRPDVVVRRDDETPLTVVDAKWKSGSASSGDVYQLTSYILALETTGALVYPGNTKDDGQESIVDGTHPLRSVGLATNAAVDSYSDYVEALEASAYAYLSAIDR
jgi:5-methylcytosine-specific restriction enzyme subunit McrC